MKKTSNTKKILLILSGFILALIFLEGILRLGGFLLLYAQERRNILSIRENGEYVILCLGESTTQGSRVNNSWPYHLENILNSGKENIIKYSVVNKGLAGTNTNIILSKVPEYIERYDPDMIIAMMGIMDSTKEEKTFSEDKKSRFRPPRVYRLMKLLHEHIMSKTKEKPAQAPRIHHREPVIVQKKVAENIPEKHLNKKGEYISSARKHYKSSEFEEADVWYKKVLEIDPENEEAVLRTVRWYNCQHQYNRSISQLKRFIALKPSSLDAYKAIGHAYCMIGEYDKAEEYLLRARKATLYRYGTHLELARCYWLQNKYKKAEEEYLKELRIDPDPAVYSELAHIYYEQKKYGPAEVYFKKATDMRIDVYNPVTRRNYIRLSDITAQEGIKLVCVQYPVRNVISLKRMLYQKRDIIFVDNEEIFKEALKGSAYDEYFVDIFAGDFGHATSKGNYLIAQNIANVLHGSYLKRIAKKSR